ncbi:MAG TPA: glycosyltransferase family 25 protein [Chlamydiales bacterium]|nr:glycosyltransferase family 25 protein [Chlamydiales bacterium]
MKCLFLLLAVSCLMGDLEDHLKKAPGKSPVHSIRNIDFIYMINLDQRPEKWERSVNQLRYFGIEPYRFSAVNGWELSLEAINDVGVKFTPIMEGGFMATSFPMDKNFESSHEIIQNYGQTYFCHCMARGTIGIALSHISVLQDAYESGYETIWVMEDDIEVLRDPRIIPDLIDALDDLIGHDSWDILFTDKDIRDQYGNHKATIWAARRPDYEVFSRENDFTENVQISPDFRKIGARYGATSMIVRRSGMKKLLQFYRTNNIFLPYDLDFILPRKIKLYTVMEDVVSNLAKALSDNGGPNYLNKKIPGGTP